MKLKIGDEIIDFPTKRWGKFSNPTLEFMFRQGATEVIPELTTPMTSEAVIMAKIQTIENGLDMMVDDVAKAKGYGKLTMSPTASLLSYAGYENQNRANAEAFGQWVASLWPIAFQMQADFLYGLIPEPTFEEVLAALPPMEWPI